MRVLQASHSSPVQVEVQYDPETAEVLRNNSRFSLKNWKLKRKLSSQNVASATSARNYEVSGLLNQRKLSKQEIFSQVM